MKGLVRALALALIVSTLPATRSPSAETTGGGLWRDGQLAGRPVEARLEPTGQVLRGKTVACARCHGSEAEGGGEGGVRAPALVRRGARSPGLDETTLARALTFGIGLDGRRLHPAMPRYALETAAVDALLAELDRLARRSIEGVEPRRLRFATVWPVGSVRESLHALVERWRALLTEEGGLFHREVELLVLPPDRSSAEARLAARPVLALLLDDAPADLLAALRARELPELFPLRPTYGREPGSVRRLGAPLAVEARLLLEALIDDLDGRGTIDIVAEPELVATLEPLLERHPALVRTSGPGVDALLLLRPPAGARARRIYAPVDLLARLGPALPAAAERIVVTDPRALPPGSPEPSPRARRLLGDPATAGPLLRHAGAALLVLETALRRLGRDVTRARLLAALDELGTVTTGLVPPWSVRPGPEAGAAVIRIDRRTGERSIDPWRRPGEAPNAGRRLEDENRRSER